MAQKQFIIDSGLITEGNSTFNGNIDMSGNKISGLADGVDNGDAVTMSQLNSISIPTNLTDLGIVDGSPDQILSTDGSGNFTFTDAPSGGGGALVTYTINRSSNSGSVTIPASASQLNIELISLTYRYAHNDSNNGSGGLTFSTNQASATYSYSLTNTGGTYVNRTVTNQGSRSLSADGGASIQLNWNGSGSHGFQVLSYTLHVTAASTVAL